MTEIARLRKYRVHVASLTSETSKAEKTQVSPPTKRHRRVIVTYLWDLDPQRSFYALPDEQASL
jgi:hypothetical protein